MGRSGVPSGRKERRTPKSNVLVLIPSFGVFAVGVGHFGFALFGVVFDFVEGAEAFGVEAAFAEGGGGALGVVQTDEVEADFAFFHLPIDADLYLADDVDGILLGQGGVKLQYFEWELVVHAYHFLTYDHKIILFQRFAPDFGYLSRRQLPFT